MSRPYDSTMVHGTNPMEVPQMNNDLLSDARARILEEDQKQLPWTPKSLERTFEVQAGIAGLVAGLLGGAIVGSHIGLAGGPLGAIAGTIPGAIIGATLGWFAGSKAGSKFNASGTGSVDGTTM